MLKYLNDETSNFKYLPDITSIVDIIDCMIMNNQNKDIIQSNLHSIVNKTLSIELDMQKSPTMKSNIVK